jgi:hypothetical protein
MDLHPETKLKAIQTGEFYNFRLPNIKLNIKYEVKLSQIELLI